MDRKLLLTALCALSSAAVYGQAEGRKNILFILTDDLQSRCIGAMGNQQVQTPNIDCLFDNGTAFVNTYTNGAIGGALSMPSRAMLMTGRGVYQVKRDGQYIPPEHKTLGETLAANGYSTFSTGKWHADKASFNRTFQEGDNIYFGGMFQYHLGGHVTPHVRHYDPTGEYPDKDIFVADSFSSEMFADVAIDYIGRASAGDKPFFAYVAFTSPHDPRNAHPGYGHLPSGDTIKLPPNFLPEHPFDNGSLTIRDEVLLPTPRQENDMRDDLANYYGMVNEVDVQIGRILDALRASGQWDNTIIVFAGDNGLAMGQHGLIGKQNLYDPSAKVPMVVVGESVPKGVMNPDYCYLYDIYPTLCDLAGVEIPSTVTGISLTGSMLEAGGRDALMLAYNNLQRAVVADGWKYIIYNVEKMEHRQLFDLRHDPWEMDNKADDPAYAAKVAEMHSLLKKEMAAAGDFCDLDDPAVWGRGTDMGWEEGLNLFP